MKHNDSFFSSGYLYLLFFIIPRPYAWRSALVTGCNIVCTSVAQRAITIPITSVGYAHKMD